MKIFSKSNITVGLITLVIGVFTVVGIAKVFRQSTTSVSGTITAFILNPEGKVDGVILDTGDQLNFGMETGVIVSEKVKIGDAISATGHAGTKSDYGRELRAETLQIGDQTITVLHSKPKSPRDERRPKPHPGDDKMPSPAPGDAKAPKTDNVNAPKLGDVNSPPVAPIPMQTMTANGQIRFVLVGGRGEARGLILSSGEQIALPKEVNDEGLTFNQETQISVEGESAQSDFGKFIHPTRLTIGNQTFSFNR
ncbi:MAG: hypothetical protein ABWZ66_01665 [Pyrinomonadaceae bacterium]